MTRIPVNGHGPVDLSQYRATDEQKAEALAHALGQAGLLCPCGQRIRQGVEYFTLEEKPIQTSQGVRRGIRAVHHHRCSRKCPQAVGLEAGALAVRDSGTGRIWWLDEARRAAAANQG